jgi:serine/threonine protein kinase
VNGLKGYQLGQRIGVGAGGPVYQAKTDTGEVAIRQFESKADPASQAWLDERQWFLQAGRQALGLTHPRIVPVFDVIDAEGEAFIVMEYMAAPTLATALLATRRYTPAETDTVLRQVAMALDFAHGRGVVHGDLKPSDIFLTERGARLSDFAISPRARRLDHSPVDASLVHGYLSPEHLRGSASIGPRADQYSLAVIAYQMYTGQSPYGNNVLDLAPAILSAPVIPPSQVDPRLPSGIDAPLLKALNRDPDQRYGSCGELFAFLGASLITQPEPVGRRVPKLVYVLAPLLLLALLAGIWLLSRKAPASKNPVSLHPAVPVQQPTATTPTGSAPQGSKSKKRPAKNTAASDASPASEVPHRGLLPAPEPPTPEVAGTAQGFTIDVLSRGDHRIENGSSFPFLDQQLGELGQGELTALVSFEGRHLQRDRLELKWIVDDIVWDRKAIVFQREPGAKQTMIVKYGNEPTPGYYRVTLEQKGRVIQSFTFRITQ